MKRKFTKYPSNYVGATSETSGAAMRRNKKEAAASAELLATDGDWELWTPHTFEASIYLAGLGGKKAVWDTAYEGNGSYYFDHFTKTGPLYIFINKNNPEEKYQYHKETNSFYNQDDRQADFDSFICEHPAFADYFGMSCDDVEACGNVNSCINCSNDMNSDSSILSIIESNRPSDDEYITYSFDYSDDELLLYAEANGEYNDVDEDVGEDIDILAISNLSDWAENIASSIEDIPEYSELADNIRDQLSWDWYSGMTLSYSGHPFTYDGITFSAEL